jgi:hypothetical protein
MWMEWVAGVEMFIESVVTGVWVMAGFGLGVDVLRQTRRWNDRTGQGHSAVYTMHRRTPGLIDRGESRQVGSKPFERGPLDARSGVCPRSPSPE